MRIKLAALALLASVLHAHAQTAGFYILKDQSSPQQILSMKTYTNAGITTPSSISSDAFGNPLSGGIGSNNPNGTALYVQGVTGGVPILATINGTPTVNLGTLNGAATATLQSSTITALGSPFQAGGSIGNTAFGISGTLPQFTSPAHFICDSGCSGGGGGGGTSSNFGSAFPAAGTALGVSNGTNMVALVLGQALSSASIPVVLPAAQVTALTPPTSVGITGTLPAFAATPTFNIGTLNGAATSALQGIGNASVASIDTKTPALGQALAAASVPVVLTASQLSTLTPPAALTNYALETGGNLGTVATNTGRIPAQGQALAAASMPVVLTAAQISTLTPLSTVAVTQSTSPWIVAGGGTAGAPGTAVLAIQGVSGGTAVPISGSVSISGGGVGVSLNTSPSLGNGNGVVPTQGGTVLSATNGLFVAPTTAATWSVTGTFWQATQPVSGTFWQATQPISAASGADVTEGQTSDTACPASGTATVLGCIRAAVNNPVTLGSASGGLSTKTLAALSNTAIAVKASAGQVYSAQCSNSDATHWAYIQIFNVAAASVTMGTTAPTKFVGIPPGSNTGFTFSLVGDQYSTAISAGAASTSTGGTGPTTALDCTVDFL
jgi:hypothetical protein